VFFKVVAEGDRLWLGRKNDIGFGTDELDVDLIGTTSISNKPVGIDGTIEFGCANSAGNIVSSRAINERTNIPFRVDEGAHDLEETFRGHIISEFARVESRIQSWSACHVIGVREFINDEAVS